MFWNTWLQRLKRNKNKKISPKILSLTSGKYGYVDVIDKSGISGWFVNLDNLEDNELSLYINGVLIGNIRPCYYRQDINQLLKRTVISGFFVSWEQFEIPESLLNADNWQIEVQYRGLPLAGRDKIEGRLLREIEKKILRASVLEFIPKQVEEDKIKFYIDKINLENNALIVIGWFFSQEGKDFVLKLRSFLEEKKFFTKNQIPREDVVQFFHDHSLMHVGFIGIVEDIREGFYQILLEVDDRTYIVGDVKIKRILKSRWVERNISSFLEDLMTKNLGNIKQYEKENLPEPVDIIIPVFNGYRHLSSLFESLIKNTNEPYRLIIVDDASTDYRVVELLHEIKQKYPSKVKLLRNEKNLGFTASVNRGLMEVDNRHVVILNTDVEVPPGWLYRLMKPIFEREDVASTTPFTNTGTICSFPEFLKDNDLSEFTVEEIDKTFSRINTQEYLINIPTGVGFCMGINKKALKEIGFFDDRNFPIGYGEENDWCMRARKRGYRNIIVPNLFVYHKHGGSFSDEKKKTLVEKHLGKLKELHPEYLPLVEDYIKENPVKPLRSLAGILLFSGKKETTLILDHSLGGGANIYRESLVKERLKEHKCILLYTANYFSPYEKLICRYDQYYLETDVKEFKNIVNLLMELNVNEIILNNLVSYRDPLSVIEEVIRLKEKKQATLIVPVHDYYALCPSYNLLNKEGVYCNVPENIDKCQDCLKENFYSEFPSVKDVLLWRRKWGGLLNKADRIICFSESSRKIVKKVYLELDDNKFRVLPHNLDIVLRKVETSRATIPLKVGVIGAINYQKGSEVIFQLAREVMERNLRMELYIIGHIHSEIPEDIKTVVKVYGRYQREDLPDIVERLGINVVLFPSIWPETFSYVVEEVISMGLPVVCFDIGAPAERLKNYDKGLVVKYMDIDGLIKALFLSLEA